MTARNELELVRALVGKSHCSVERAEQLLEKATRLKAEVFKVIALEFGIDMLTLYQRAAQMVGLNFSADVTAEIIPLAPGADISRLSEIRQVKADFGAKKGYFIAPNFTQISALRARVRAEPGLTDTLVVTTPNILRTGLLHASRKRMLNEAVVGLQKVVPYGAGQLQFKPVLRFVFLVLLILSAAWAIIMPPIVLLWSAPIFFVFLTIPSAFRIWAALNAHKIEPHDTEHFLRDEDLPLYSVLIPLRDEANMVSQIARAMVALDYPPEKLDIKFVVEEVSPATVEAARQELRDPRFSLIIVPNLAPFTKPKALNYAMPLVGGEFVVVFDAEDIPEPNQLRKAATLMRMHKEIDCLQAELVIANAHKNLITRMFAIEYAGHFGVLLPAIAHFGLPMPLGGTSNHFRTQGLRFIGGWDPFNVTEDADIGIRMARMRLRSASFSAATAEEAPTQYWAWVKQRSRWMKGWMQTLLVHFGKNSSIYSELRKRDLFAVIVFLGGMMTAILSHAVFALGLVATVIKDLMISGGITYISLMNISLLLLGYMGAASIGYIGVQRLGRPELAKYLWLLPFYWILCAAAVLRGAWQLFTKPFYWEKTKHNPIRQLNIQHATKSKHSNSLPKLKRKTD